MVKKHPQIKSQDVLLLMKLMLDESESRIVDIAGDLELSLSEVSEGIRRLRDANLIEKGSRKPLKENMYEFVIHAVKYIFPGKLGTSARGVPTAHSALPLSKLIKSSTSDVCVWPYDEGEVRGQSIMPLYPTVPSAAVRNPELHQLLALLDAIRIGRAREQKLAAKELQKRIFGRP